MINPDKKKPCKWVQCPLTYISCHHRYEAADKYVCVWKREWKAWVCVFQTNRDSKSQNNGKHQQPQIRVQSWTRRFLFPPLLLPRFHTQTTPTLKLSPGVSSTDMCLSDRDCEASVIRPKPPGLGLEPGGTVVTRFPSTIILYWKQCRWGIFHN